MTDTFKTGDICWLYYSGKDEPDNGRIKVRLNSGDHRGFDFDVLETATMYDGRVYEAGGMYNIVAIPDYLEKIEPVPTWVHVDSNGEVQFPDWVKSGYYKPTVNADGSIILEPLMTRAEWEAAK